MILSFYFARKYVAAFAVVFGLFFGILYMIDVVEQTRNLSGTSAGFADTAALALLNVPASVYRILPLVAILAAIMLFLGLARSSELVVTRAAGRSALSALVAPVTAALLLGAFAVAVLNPVVAGTSKRYEALSGAYRLGEDNALSVSAEGFWLRQGTPEGQSVIRAQRTNADGTVLHQVTLFTFSGGSGPVTRIEAETAELKPGAWSLKGVKLWSLVPGQNPEAGAQVLPALDVPSDLTPDRIRDSFGDPSDVPIWELPAFIADLEKAGFSARKHAVWLQTELAQPLLLAAMVLLGAGFTMRHTRFGRTGLMVLLAVVSGFTIFFVRNFAQVLGENGQIPIALAAWIPPIAAILLALALLLHMEDG